MNNILESLGNFMEKYFEVPKFYATDIIEILIIAIVIYEVVIWIRKTMAWSLLKGIIVIALFMIVAALFHLSTILWIANKTLSVAIIALLIIFQPELRKALEQLGRRNIILGIFKTDGAIDEYNEDVADEIIKATFEMAKNKTGALIVIEKKISLDEYEKTGITLDSKVSSQLLINIFEHNTPLHDGAVIIRNDRITSATCYLPLSDNLMISKDLGTRHRAALGISEVTDSTTIVVSEETGRVTIAREGNLIPCKTGEVLRSELIPKKEEKKSSKKFKIWKGRKEGNEKGTDNPSENVD